MHVLATFWPKKDRMPNDPNGTRTRVAGVKGRSPRPLDDGAAAGSVSGTSVHLNDMNRQAECRRLKGERQSVNPERASFGPQSVR